MGSAAGSFAVVDADAHVRLVEDLADLVADGVVDPLHVELGGERRLHAVDDRELGGTLLALLEQALRLVEEARVLQRDAHARGHGIQQPDFGFAERVLALVVLEDDRAEHPVAAQNRDEHRRLTVVGAWNDTDAQRGRLGLVVHHERLARCGQPLPCAARCRRGGGHDLPDAVLVLIQVVKQVCRRIVPADADVAGAEHFAQLVADEVDDRLEVELGGDALLDAVDDGELGGALLALLEQPLRLVEEPRVLERDAHAVGERLQQPDVGLAEGVLALAGRSG